MKRKTPRVKKSDDSCFHDLKIILLNLTAKYFGCNFKFHSNLHFKDNVLKKLRSFYKQI